MTEQLKVTPLTASHRTHGAKFVPFAGYKMPVTFQGLKIEHLAVRRNVGLFDVSHMGELDIRGPGALDFVQGLITNDLKRIVDSQAQYTVACNENAGILDDLIVYRHNDEHIFVCMNASNRGKITDWFVGHAPAGITVEDQSDDYAQIAVQGPTADALLETVLGTDAVNIRPFFFKELTIDGQRALIARTGYTGESGVEIFLPNRVALGFWDALVENGGLPCGLAARDTLRLEMGYCLYGNDIDETTNPLEAGLKWVVRLKKGDFIGRDALIRARKSGIKRKLVGFRMLERAIGRQHHQMFDGDVVVGEITSGTMSPTLGAGIGMAYVDTEHASVGNHLEIQIRKKRVTAEIVRPPFYKKEGK